MQTSEAVPATVRAVRYDEFGPAEVLRVVDLPVPRVGPDEVLVKVRAAGVGGGEAPIRAGRLRRVMRTRPPAGVGNDFTGHVAAVGAEVRRLRVRDAVWGLMPHLTFGSTAEYVAVPERLVAPAPGTVDLVDAAALPSAGTTVLTALTEKAELRPGQRLLVRGGSGGVGTVAVQLGRSLGAHVTALASARNLAWVRDLGADEAVDYRGDAATRLAPFDVIVDTVGTDLPAVRRMLARRGRMVALAVDPGHLAANVLFLARGTLSPSRRVVAFSNNPGTERLVELTRYVEDGTLRPVVDTVFPMDRTAEAHRRIEAGGVRGKYVIDVARG
ncbi:NAD(P)-dependent alcohol dehydrogenase [Jidongwangia harbinensis]|uniref:NAD(P)-dependent alcohol dehydrogenase n=1 Tax=Jidongwangia harbinensis TaxID=2878561 RepID=UPI001CD96DC4|nr:NAD(P)-dependent alcohol dehydrogenase [Jidongwangia harbinensis]MCA2216002.1 NAD(P)-dependent alcohol dehydrogenase [Jidongwangia harbinensis]